jgi:hypothetical protein
MFKNKPYQFIVLYYSVTFHSNVSFHPAPYLRTLADICAANSLPLMDSIPFSEAFQSLLEGKSVHQHMTDMKTNKTTTSEQ